MTAVDLEAPAQTATPTLELDWIPNQGAVRFTVYNVPNDGRTTVKRVNPGGLLSAIRGYKDGTWHSDSGLGYDYEAPMGVLVTYAIVDMDATNLTQSTSYVTQATNLAPNPALESGAVTGWLSNGGAVYPVTADNTAPISGSWSALSTRGSTSPSSAAASLTLVPTAAVNPGFPCTVGQPIVLSYDWKAEQANRKATAYWSWVDGAGNVVTNQPIAYQNMGASVANAVYRMILTGVPPAGTVTARPVVSFYTGDGSNAITGERVWLDRLRISTGPVTTDALNLHPNPSCGDSMASGSLTYWISNNATLYPTSLDASAPISGRYSCMSTRASSATTPQVPASISLGGLQTGTMLPVTPGVPVTGALDIKTEQPGRQVQLYYTFWDAAGTTLIATGVKSAQIPLTDNGVTRVSWTDTPPAAGVGARLVIQTTTVDGSAAPVGERTWFDNARVSVGAGATTEFFTGSTPPDGTYVYAWTGTVGASTSQRYRVSDAQMTDATYFDGDTAAGGGFRYVWTGTAKASTSQKQLAVTSWPPQDTIFTQSDFRKNGEAWLRDVMQPALSRPISFVSSGDEVYAARQTILDVAGKRTPYVVWDSRQARQGTVTLLVWNDVRSGIYNDSTRRDKLEALFSTGRPLLLSVCASLGFRNAYLAIDSVTWTRVGSGAAWLVQLAYFEVDNPTGLQVNITPEVTYASAQQLPPSATYADWASVTYFAIATRTSIT